MSAHPRVLFCTYHCLFDPTSGAARSACDLLELLAARGWAVGVLCGPVVDTGPVPVSEAELAAAAPRVQPWAAGPPPVVLFHCTRDGVPVTVCRADESTRGGVPSPAAGAAFLAVFEEVVRAFRPDVLVTYGGRRPARAVIDRSRALGLRVVFFLRNFLYRRAAAFAGCDAVVVPSEAARRHYAALGVRSTAIPGPWVWERFRCDRVDGRYVTLVNPSPEKGVYLLARLVAELAGRRPDIPFLVVEGRAAADRLGRCGVDLSGVRTVSRMARTDDPRRFYAVTRLLLVPSAWAEAYARVAVEAVVNGIPVLGSDRGGLPETLAAAGRVLPLPGWLTEHSRRPPSEAEVRPWAEAVEHLWDHPVAYSAEQARCETARAAWHPDTLVPKWERLLTALVGDPSDRRDILMPGIDL